MKKDGLRHKISQKPAQSHFHFPSYVLIFIFRLFTVSAPCIQIIFSFLSWTSCRLVTANHIYHKLRVFKSKPRQFTDSLAAFNFFAPYVCSIGDKSDAPATFVSPPEAILTLKNLVRKPGVTTLLNSMGDIPASFHGHLCRLCEQAWRQRWQGDLQFCQL